MDAAGAAAYGLTVVLVRRSGDQRPDRGADCVGAGALPFPGKRLFDALIDCVRAAHGGRGLVYSSLYVESGWLGRFLVPLGIQAAYSRLAIVSS